MHTMHNCRETKNILVDLAFAGLEPGQQQKALSEISNCPSCSQEYQSMLAALRAFDQAADAGMPDESYWVGYDARLRTRLAESHSSNLRERVLGWLTGLVARPAVPVAIASGLILFIAISSVWFFRLKTDDPQFQWPDVKTTAIREGNIDRPQSPEVIGDVAPVSPVKSGQHRSGRVGGQRKKSEQTSVVAANLSTSAITSGVLSDAAPVTVQASHFEKAQLLLRSFRNARAEGENATVDLSYEKREARKLVNDNILLRREAEAKRYLPVEDALNSLEPLLLDIANLPDKPSRGEVQLIRERIQKQEIIATLQVVSFRTERFSPPALLNP